MTTELPMMNIGIPRTPEEFDALRRKAVEVVKYYVELANEKLGINLKMPKVTFDIKGTAGGYAHVGAKNWIQLNPTLLFENPEKFLKRTPGHEVAHLATHAKYGFGKEVTPHGHHWQSVMWALDATRCHSYDTSNVPTRIGKVKTKVAPTKYRTQLGITQSFAHGKITELD
jgi:predicted SprT family Zn-dependent metalloprotease